MNRTEAFAKYNAQLKNTMWSVSAENGSGELIVSLWKHHFTKPLDGKIVCKDHVSRWSGPGNTEFRENISKAFSTEQTVRVVISRTKDKVAVQSGVDASSLRNTFHPREDWIGKVTLWDGDNYEIEFGMDA